MLTTRSSRPVPVLLGAGAAAILMALLAPCEAVADDGQGGFSVVRCAQAECQLTVGTHAAQPNEGTHPMGSPGGVRWVRSTSSNTRPAVCGVANLEYSCPMTGPSPSPDATTHLTSPEDVARSAIGQLRLPTPRVRMNPDVKVAQVVHVPTWLWIDQADWRSVSRTVGVPGVTVTATATPLRVVWSMGDGGSVSCAGPGTPFSSLFPAASRSLDCGYVYPKSSAGQPGEVFTVTATVVWDVKWRGGGKSGTITGLQRSTRVPVRVAEVQGIVVSGTGRI